MLNSPWQIVQLTQTGHPGQFRVFALIGHELHTLKVINNIKRIMNHYILPNKVYCEVMKKFKIVSVGRLKKLRQLCFLLHLSQDIAWFLYIFHKLYIVFE